MGKPHKHAEVIKAWADGEDIQYSLRPDFKWRDMNPLISPTWTEEANYRIKPKNIEVDMFIQHEESKFTTTLFTPNGIHRSNVRFTFSPEGKLLSVEKL